MRDEKGKLMKGSIPWNKGIKAPQIARAKTGNKNPMWNGGIIYRNGYKFIKDRKHPSANTKGYIRSSWLVVEKKIKRYIKKGEVVHHINGNKTDDSQSNLYLFKNTGLHTSYERNYRITCKKWIENNLNLKVN